MVLMESAEYGVWCKLHIAVDTSTHEIVYGYHKRSLLETGMHRVKQLLGGKLSLRDYNAQVGEAYAMINHSNEHSNFLMLVIKKQLQVT